MPREKASSLTKLFTTRKRVYLEYVLKMALAEIRKDDPEISDDSLVGKLALQIDEVFQASPKMKYMPLLNDELKDKLEGLP